MNFKANSLAVISFLSPQLSQSKMYTQKLKQAFLLSGKAIDHSDLIAPFLGEALTCISLTEKIKCFHHPAILNS